jgi:hypothetical protein
VEEKPFCYVIVMDGDATLRDLDDWVVVDSKATSQSTYYPRLSIMKRCKNVGKNVLDCWKKAMYLYRVYRVVRMCINIYILYCALK